MEEIIKSEIKQEKSDLRDNSQEQNNLEAQKNEKTFEKKRPFKPRNQRPYNKDNRNSENGTALALEGSETDENTKAPFKKRKAKPRFINKDMPQYGEGWTNDLKRAYITNEKIHKDRLNPHYKLNLNTSAKLRITPLGGLNEIGGNMMVVETENEAIVVDVGMSFPDGEMHGVDILIPDFTYLREIKDKIVAVIITHGHEDHIGAMPYLYKEMQFPIYGSPLPLEMIGSKFDEHKMREHRALFRAISKRTPIKIGNDFEIE